VASDSSCHVGLGCKSPSLGTIRHGAGTPGYQGAGLSKKLRGWCGDEWNIFHKYSLNINNGDEIIKVIGSCNSFLETNYS